MRFDVCKLLSVKADTRLARQRWNCDVNMSEWISIHYYDLKVSCGSSRWNLEGWLHPSVQQSFPRYRHYLPQDEQSWATWSSFELLFLLEFMLIRYKYQNQHCLILFLSLIQMASIHDSSGDTKFCIESFKDKQPARTKAEEYLKQAHDIIHA